MIEKETFLSDRYLKPPYGGNGGERDKLSYMHIICMHMYEYVTHHCIEGSHCFKWLA